MSLLDVATDIKPWLGIDPAVTTHDAILGIINEAIESAVLNYVETTFEVSEATDLLDGTISDVILPHNTPIRAVEEIYFCVEGDGTGGSLLDESSYTVRPEGIYLRDISTPRGRSTIKITYTYGYDGLPADVKLMMLQAVEAEWRRKTAKTLGIASRSKKDESESYVNDLGQWDQKTGLPSVLVAKLTPYKSFDFPILPMAQRNW